MNAMELSWAIEGLFRLFDWNLIIDSELSNYAYEFEAADKKVVYKV